MVVGEYYDGVALVQWPINGPIVYAFDDAAELTFFCFSMTTKQVLLFVMLFQRRGADASKNRLLPMLLA